MKFFAHLVAVLIAVGFIAFWIGYSSLPGDVEATEGYAWTEHSSPGKDGWKVIVSSDNGEKLAAAVENGPLYTSEDYGATWTEQTAAGSRAWMSLAMSNDGSKLAGVDYGGFVHLSDDGGVTWVEQTSAPQNQWNSIAMSGDGGLIVAAGDGTEVYTTDNWGTDWVEHNVGETAWRALTVSEDGVHVIAASGGYLYRSENSGNDWKEDKAAGQRAWTSVDISPDGSKALAAADGDYVYLWDQDSDTWTELLELGQWSWSSVILSSSAKQAAAVANGGPAYLISNTLSDFTEQLELGSDNWTTVAASSDFSRIVLAGNNTNIFTATSDDSAGPIISNVSSGTPSLTSATITWTTDELATSQVFYGPTTAYGYSTPAASVYDTNHSVTINSLASSATYHFVVVSSDGVPNTSTSTDRMFTTLAMATDDDVIPEGETRMDPPASSASSIRVFTRASEDPCSPGYKNPDNIKTYDSKVLITRDIKRCSKGEDVKVLQDFLIDKGYLGGKSTGYFGYETERAVEKLREDLGIRTSMEYVGPYARAVLYMKSLEANGVSIYPANSLNSANPTNSAKSIDPLDRAPADILTRDLEYGVTGADVVYLQKFLTDKGYLGQGHLSAYFGDLTKQALVAFQQAVGIEPAAGYFGPKTRAYIINLKAE